MDLRSQSIDHGLDNCESAFFEDMPMIVTSSPIEGRRGENSSPLTFRNRKPEENRTWSELLCKYNKKQWVKSQAEQATSFTTASDVTSSSYQPIAEHKMKVLLTPGKRMQVISSSAKKIQFRQPTPKKLNLYSKLNQQYWQKFESVEDKEDESIQTIKKKLKNTEELSAEDILRYENILRNFIKNRETKKEESSKAACIENSDLMKLIEKQLGQCNLSPRTVRMLAKESQDQEKRLIGLAVVKRKSTAETKKRINGQLVETKQQIKDREQQELKLVRAAQLRHKAKTESLLFNQAHSAHHKRIVTETRQKDDLTRLQRQLQSEKMKNSTQVNKIVRDVWKTFLEEQYDELRKEVREHQLQKATIVRESEADLKRLKVNYEEKLKELKNMAAAKAAEAGMEKKEISREIERIQRNMQHQFQAEFQTLLRNIETHGDHKRFKREEKASSLKEQLKKADFVFDL